MKQQTTKKKAHSSPTGLRVTRADVHMPDDSGKTAAQLQADIDQSGPKAAEGPPRRTVARKDIHLAEAAFQWRGDRRWDQWARDNHIYTLSKVIQDSEEPLDRLLVMPVGELFYVIDGHHRLAAYDTAGWAKGIPVDVFAGNLTEARVRALASNVKDKLPMTDQAKSEAAWTITKEDLGDLTAQQVRQITGKSVRTVRSMRQVWRELNERKGVDRDDLMKLTWPQARRLWEGKTVHTDNFDRDDWKQQQAQAVVDLIRKHNVAKGLLDDPEVTALALRMLSEKLPERLIEEWAADHPELISELAERIANPPEDVTF
jgi:ParB-like chromosome segregation protein Spo0J